MSLKDHSKVVLCLLILLLLPRFAPAILITIDKNGYEDLAGGQITGPGLSGPVPFGTDTNSVSFNAQAGGAYLLDFFHNSGVSGSDFVIYINSAGTGVASNSLGGGVHTMVAGFNPGDATLHLNTQTITYNANSGQQGVYYLYGSFAPYSRGLNSGPWTGAAVPGWIAVDNLSNQGLNNEDYQFMVNDNGTVSAFTNPTPAYAEYASFTNSSVSPRSVKVHYTVYSSTNLCCGLVSYVYPVLNPTFTVAPSGNLRYIYSFDLFQTIGNSGQLFSDPHSNTVLRSDLMGPAGYGFSIFDAGPSIVGNTSGNDFTFNPRLRWTNDLNAPFALNGYYFENIDGSSLTSYALISGNSDGLGGLPPLTMYIVADIPEPAGLLWCAVAVVGSALWWRRRR